MKGRKHGVLPRVAALTLAGLFALRSVSAEGFPLKRVALFSSGVGYFEHTQTVTGDFSADVSFPVDYVNDVLKSLIINDPGSLSPSVTYASDETSAKTLRSLMVDLSGEPDMAAILAGLRGALVILQAPNAIEGRIVGVESRSSVDASGDTRSDVPWLMVLTASGLQSISFLELSSVSFKDPAIARDFNRALDVLKADRDAEARALTVRLPGMGTRSVTLGYVVPSPVWKVSYRLDLAGDKPRLQGWAIIDNASDVDWEGVELTLVTGRPVSFIQPLYPPFHVARPVLPLSIAGVASAEVYDSGFENAPEEELALSDYGMKSEYAEAAAPLPRAAPSLSKARAVGGAAPMGSVETARASSSGEQFTFTVRNPVTIERQRGAMIPLVEAKLDAERVSVFSASKALNGGMTHPMLCVRVANTTGMQLPAGPITVYDEANYAGDALIEFFPERDTRLLAYGEDLSVTGSVTQSSSRAVDSVTVSRGVMRISRKVTHRREYALKNASSRDRVLFIEHPITSGATLSMPKQYVEKTAELYRFKIGLAKAAEAKFAVEEQSAQEETVVLQQQRLDALLYYSSSGELPPKTREAIDRAIAFRKAIDARQAAVTRLEEQRAERITEQARVRENLSVAGSDTQQGKDYLKKMTGLDVEIETVSKSLEEARKALATSKEELSSYLAGLTIE